MGTSATAGGDNGTVAGGEGAVGGGIGDCDTAVRLFPQNEQKVAVGGASLPQLGQYGIKLVHFSI